MGGKLPLEIRDFPTHPVCTVLIEKVVFSERALSLLPDALAQPWRFLLKLVEKRVDQSVAYMSGSVRVSRAEIILCHVPVVALRASVCNGWLAAISGIRAQPLGVNLKSPPHVRVGGHGSSSQIPDFYCHIVQPTHPEFTHALLTEDTISKAR